jgi:hypothetical protein
MAQGFSGGNIVITSVIDAGNSSTTPLNTGNTFTGTWYDATAFSSVTVAVKTDQNGYFTIQFSPDGINADSTLTRYYRTTQIEAPHRFTVTRRYVRITFTNDSGSNQTYLRLQTILGGQGDLNAPSDSVLAQDFDAVVTRPTEFRYEVALGRRQGCTTWNMWGYNSDIDIGTETVWSQGGSFTRIVTARTLSVVSTDVNDTSAGTGARSVIIYGVNANFESQTEVVTLSGTTPVVTSATWMGVNRVAIYAAGSGGVNAGDITATATTEATVQAHMPAGAGASQQAIFFVQANHQALMDWLYITLVKNSGGTQPNVQTKCWVTSLVSGAKYEVFRDYMNGSVENHTELTPSQPFVVGEKSLVEFTSTTDVNNTEVAVRFSLIEVRDVDA